MKLQRRPALLVCFLLVTLPGHTAPELSQELTTFYEGLEQALVAADRDRILAHYLPDSPVYQEAQAYATEQRSRFKAVEAEFEVIKAVETTRGARATVRVRLASVKDWVWESTTEWREVELVRAPEWKIAQSRTIPPADNRVEVDFSGAEQMIAVLRALKADDPQANRWIDRMLASEVYRLAFFPHHNRTPGTLPPGAYKKLLLALPSGQFPALPELSKRARNRLNNMWENLRRAYEDPGKLEGTLAHLRSLDFTAQGVSRATEWLPPGYRIDTHFYFLCDGRSGGYAINDVSTDDLLQMNSGPDGRPRYDVAVMAHELHHNGFTRLPNPLDEVTRDDLHRQLLASFLGVVIAEGTPSRFINEMPSGFIGEAKTEWQNYEENYHEIFSRYEQTLENHLGRTGDPTEARSDLINYWLSGWHGPAYFVGVRMMDAVFRVAGKEGVFAVLLDRSQLLTRYNEAAQKLNATGERLYLFDGGLAAEVASLPKRIGAAGQAK